MNRSLMSMMLVVFLEPSRKETSPSILDMTSWVMDILRIEKVSISYRSNKRMMKVISSMVIIRLVMEVTIYSIQVMVGFNWTKVMMFNSQLSLQESRVLMRVVEMKVIYFLVIGCIVHVMVVFIHLSFSQCLIIRGLLIHSRRG